MTKPTGSRQITGYIGSVRLQADFKIHSLPSVSHTNHSVSLPVVSEITTHFRIVM